MEHIRRIFQANKMLQKSSMMNSARIIFNVLYLIFILLVLAPIPFHIFTGKNLPDGNYYFLMFFMAACYSSVSFMNSGFSITQAIDGKSNRKKDLLMFFYFTPLKKTDLIKATILNWTIYYLFLSIPTAIIMTANIVSNSPKKTLGFVGLSAVFVSIVALVNGICIALTFFTKRNKKSALLLSVLPSSIAMLLFGASSLLFSAFDFKINVNGLEFLCSPLGIVLVFSVIPIVWGFTAIMTKLIKNKAWFNE